MRLHVSGAVWLVPALFDVAVWSDNRAAAAIAVPNNAR